MSLRPMILYHNRQRWDAGIWDPSGLAGMKITIHDGLWALASVGNIVTGEHVLNSPVCVNLSKILSHGQALGHVQIVRSHRDMEVCRNGGTRTPKWLVYSGKYHEPGWFRGTPMTSETSMYLFLFTDWYVNNASRREHAGYTISDGLLAAGDSLISFGFPTWGRGLGMGKTLGKLDWQASWSQLRSEGQMVQLHVARRQLDMIELLMRFQGSLCFHKRFK